MKAGLYRFPRPTKSFSFRLLIVTALSIAALFFFVVPVFAQGDSSSSVLYSRESLFTVPVMAVVTLLIANGLGRVLKLSANVTSIIALGVALLLSIGHQLAVAKEPDTFMAILLVIVNTFVIWSSAYGTNEFLAPRPGTSTSGNNLLSSWRNPSSGSIA